jgi:hypothetical protein
MAAEELGAVDAELAAGLNWTAVAVGHATAAIDKHVRVSHRTPGQNVQGCWTRCSGPWGTARSNTPTTPCPACNGACNHFRGIIYEVSGAPSRNLQACRTWASDANRESSH